MYPQVTLIALLIATLRPLSPPFLTDLSLIRALCLAAEGLEASPTLLRLARQVLPPPPALEARGALALPALVVALARCAQVLACAQHWLLADRTLGEALADHAVALGLRREVGLALVPAHQHSLTGPRAVQAVNAALARVLDALAGLEAPARERPGATERPPAAEMAVTTGAE